MTYLSIVGCAVAIVLNSSGKITLVKSGGGFFPLHKFESAQTAFLIIVRRFCLANSLQNTFYKPCFINEFNSKCNKKSLGGIYLLHKRRKNVAIYDKVSAFCAISCYVSQGPDCLRNTATTQVSQERRLQCGIFNDRNMSNTMNRNRINTTV